MNILNIEQFATIVYSRPLTNVFVGIESIVDDPIEQWARLEGGPILVCFEDVCILLRQPIGKCQVEIVLSSLEESAMLVREGLPDPETKTALMQIFESACYPSTFDHIPPSVAEVKLFQNPKAKSVGGIILELSTGGSFGIDASSYGGLVWFLDGQASIFRRKYVDVMLLQEVQVARRGSGGTP